MKNKSTFDSRKLFSTDVSNYKVRTKKHGTVNYVNLDNAATTPPFLDVQTGANEFLAGYGSIHRGAGAKSKISTDIYENSREVIKNFVNAPADSYVLFTENTTGAMNAAAHFFSFLKGKVAVSAIEHSSSWLPWIKTEGAKKLGNKQSDLKHLTTANERIQLLGRKQVIQYDVNDKFEFDLASIEKILKNNRVKALVLTASSNITGYCPEIEKIGKLVHKYQAMFVVDACQFIQHHPIDMEKMGIDFLAASGHKFYAPYGSGFLIGPKKFFDNFLPYEIGGGNLPYITQDGEFLRYKNQLAHDPGTANAVGAVAVAIALKKIKALGFNKIQTHERFLTEKLFKYMKSNSKIEIFVSKDHLNTIIPFRIKGLDARLVADKLNTDHGIGVRAGSFCVYHVLRKLLNIKNDSDIVNRVKNGKTDNIPALIRASISLCNTENDIDRMIAALEDITKQ